MEDTINQYALITEGLPLCIPCIWFQISFKTYKLDNFNEIESLPPVKFKTY